MQHRYCPVPFDLSPGKDLGSDRLGPPCRAWEAVRYLIEDRPIGRDAGGGLRPGERRSKDARCSKDARRIGGRPTPPTWGHNSLPYLKFRLVCGHVGTQFTEENGVGSRNELA